MATILENFETTLNFLEGANAPTEIIDFIEGRLNQEKKSRDNARAKRSENGEKKDITQSDFYVSLREALYKVLTTAPMTGDELIAAAQFNTPSGKKAIAAQVSTALKPLIDDGTVVVETKKVSYVDKHGLNKESNRKAYRLA